VGTQTLETLAHALGVARGACVHQNGHRDISEGHRKSRTFDEMRRCGHARDGLLQSAAWNARAHGSLFLGELDQLGISIGVLASV
jgi:hypothetical protein